MAAIANNMFNMDIILDKTGMIKYVLNITERKACNFCEKIVFKVNLNIWRQYQINI